LQFSKTAVWRWVVKLREKLNITSERKARRFIAVDGHAMLTTNNIGSIQP
jgi:hypothetical protein